MSQSTPINELQGNTEPTNNAVAQPTKPLVQDILKEIQQENEATNSQTQDPLQVPASQAQTAEQSMEVPPAMTESGNGEYVQQQEQALQYQMDPSVQPQSDVSMPPVEAVPDPSVMQGTVMSDELSVDYGAKTTSGSQRILEHLKDPLLVVLLSILLSVPAVSQFILTQVSRIPGGGNQMVPILIRAVLAGVLFYTLRRFV